MQYKISVTILTKNSEKYLEEVLSSVRDFDEVLLLDNGSTDRTFEIAKKFSNVSLHHSPFIGFGPLHNKASSLARNDWILSLDSDEVLTKELAKEIAATGFDEGSVYSFPVENYYNSKFIRWCGWYPDRHVRIYNRQVTSFTDSQVHEGIIVGKLREQKLTFPIKHYSYANTSDFLTKMQRYSDLFAEQNRGKKKSSLWKAITHGLGAFLKSYFLKKGFLGGYEGFVISIYNANTAFYKYLKLREINSEVEKGL